MLDHLIMSSPILKVEGELSQPVANLLRKLKYGQSARCSIPRFGLRFSR
jgi:hypothetical protein